MKRGRVTIAAMLVLSACSGPVRTHFGGLAPAPGQDRPATIAVAAESMSDRRWPTIQAALAGQGMALDTASPYQLAFTFGSRPASSAILGPRDTVLSARRKRHLFQSCAAMNYRLVVTLMDTRNGELVGRGWADESHCHAASDEALPSLASRAATMLVHPVSAGSELRWARD